MWTATSDVEHAVCTSTLGPRRSSLYETRVVRKSLSLESSHDSGPAQAAGPAWASTWGRYVLRLAPAKTPVRRPSWSPT